MAMPFSTPGVTAGAGSDPVGRPLPHHVGCSCCSPPANETEPGLRATRRHLLGAPLGVGALAAFGATITEAARMPAAFAAEPSPQTPEAAVAALLAGNKRYVAARLGVCAQNLHEVLRETEDHQAPFAAVLSCTDSRIPVELVFDQGVGRIFVARVAGNIAAPEIIASLEYGVAVLGTRAILVLGHGDCGAVKAAMERKSAPGQISGLYAFIRPAVDQAGKDADTAIRVNAALQARSLARSSPVLAGAIAEQRLRIVPAYYDVASGMVTLLEV
jgi:carbonic anhydrase